MSVEKCKSYGPVHEILALIACVQTLLINAHADISSNVRGLDFGLSLHLHPCFMYASSKGSGESLLICRPA